MSLLQVALIFASVHFARSAADADNTGGTPGACPGAISRTKVIVLAGQSNMEGWAKKKLWEHQATDEKTRAFFTPFRDNNNTRWVERDDVLIKFLGRKGPLTFGYGADHESDDGHPQGYTGLEYAFGLRVGDHFDEPVLLIKVAWGGRSLWKDFRPPSSGLPGDLGKVLALEYGRDYRLMIDEVQSTMKDAGKLFPQLNGTNSIMQLAGFVWFQGWNDQYGSAELEYEQNLRNFITDVRSDLEAPQLPFVIGVMGQNGAKPAEGAMLAIQKAQTNVGDMDRVVAVRTDVLEDEAAAKLYPGWAQHMEEWERTGSDHRYHYLGSAIWYSRIGFVLGEALIKMNSLNLLAAVRAGLRRKVVVAGTSLSSVGYGNWPSLLEPWLKDEAPDPMNVTVVNLAISGSNSQTGGINQLASIKAENPDTVFMEFSMNDAYNAPWGVSLAQATANHNFIICDLRAFNPNIEIIIQTMNNPIGSGHTVPRGGLRNLEAYYQVARDVATYQGLLLVDHYPNWWKLYVSNQALWNAYVPDGIHPTTTGYANILMPELQQALELPTSSPLPPSVPNSTTTPVPSNEKKGATMTPAAIAGIVVSSVVATFLLIVGALATALFVVVVVVRKKRSNVRVVPKAALRHDKKVAAMAAGAGGVGEGRIATPLAADPAVEGSVEGPMPQAGVVVGTKSRHAGGEGDAPVVLSAIKMETVVSAPMC